MTLGSARTRVLLVAVVVYATAGAGLARAQALGYGIAGPAGVSGFFGSSTSSVHAAGGGEVLVGGRAGAGAELGVLANAGSALWVVSANGVFHVSAGAAKARRSPFITGGYTHMGSGEGAFSAWNVGAGIDLWLRDRLGLRLDFRDHVRPDTRGTVHYWTVRAGVTFR